MGGFDATNYTVELRVGVPVALSAGGWGWGPAEGLSPAAQEYVYSCQDLVNVLRAFGRLLVSAGLVTRAHGDRFTVTGYAVVGGKLMGRDQWLWSDEASAFEPHGDPWCVWSHQVPEAECAKAAMQPRLAA